MTRQRYVGDQDDPPCPKCGGTDFSYYVNHSRQCKTCRNRRYDEAKKAGGEAFMEEQRQKKRARYAREKREGGEKLRQERNAYQRLLYKERQSRRMGIDL